MAEISYLINSRGDGPVGIGTYMACPKYMAYPKFMVYPKFT
jgi:hypothetical protein